MASTPVHSHVRAIAPKLRTSVIPSRKNNEWNLPLLEQRRDYISQPLIRHRRNKSDHSLMIFAGNPVQSFDRYTLDEKSTTFYQIEKFFRQIALKVFFYQNLIYFLSGFHCFYYSSDAKIISFFSIFQVITFQ